jgi:tyrosinase
MVSIMYMSAFVVFAFFALVAHSQSYDYGVDIEALTRRQDGERIVVGRLPSRDNGTVPHRLEVRQMKADRHKWDLFILAMSMFQYVSQDDPLSWYQVAGKWALHQISGAQS